MQKPKKRKKRYTWSFDRMHPVLKGVLIGAASTIMIVSLWLISWCVYFAHPEMF